MDIRFDGKRALVTGGGRGIGREIARSLVRCGAKTFVLTKSSSSVEHLRMNYPDIEVIQVDLTDWDATRKAVEGVLPIDVLVNNAGISRAAPFLDCTQSDIDAHFDVHYKATFNVSQIIAKDLISKNKPGSIINISSVSSIMHIPDLCASGTSKAALDSLTKYMALELGPKQIRVNAINPTYISTDMTEKAMQDEVTKEKIIAKIPAGRFGEVSEVAEVALFLLSNRASLVNGVILPVDGGNVL